jgi:carboxyl-terminal processing protease
MNRICTVSVVAVSLWLLASVGSTTAEEDTFNPRATIRTAVTHFERVHLSRTVLNDELSRKWLRSFLARLDPNRMYFLRSDFQEFQRFENHLDDLAKNGDFQFPELVRKRYRKRTREAVSYAEEFLSLKHDYSVDEEFPIRFDGYATKREEIRERWRLQLKAELLIEKLHGRPWEDVQSQLSGRYQRIARQARKMTDERLCEIYLNSLASIYDPHSAYFSPTTLESFSQTATSRTYHLGLDLRQRAGWFMITSLHPSLRNLRTQSKLVGWNLIAIRRLDGTTFDLVEVHPVDLGDMITRSFHPLKSDTEIILELMNPVTYERLTMSWNRFPSN